jgi:hypothetical protein
MFNTIQINWWTELMMIAAIALLVVSFVLKMHEWGIYPLREMTRFLRRPWFEVVLLVFFVGGMVQYGSTKGFLGGAPSMMCSPMAFVPLPTVTGGSGGTEGPQFPAYTNAVTNACFTGILPASTSVFLRAEWPMGTSLPENALEIYARHDLTTNGWEGVGTAFVGGAAESVIIELPHAYLPGGWANSMVFVFGLCTDTDNDGLSDAFESLVAQTDSSLADSDEDELPDGWEYSMGLDPLSGAGDNGAAADMDADGISNLDEYRCGTHPTKADTDNDGLDDGQEVGLVEELRGADFLWFDTTGHTSAFGTSSYYDYFNRKIALPFSVEANGVCYTNAQIDLDGLVTLINPNNQSASIGSGYNYSYGMSNRLWSANHITIAAYNANVYAKPNTADWGSAFTYGSVTTNGENYTVVEYRNVGHCNLRNETTPRLMSVQVVLPSNETNVVYVSYRFVDEAITTVNEAQTFGVQLPATNCVPGRGIYANVSWGKYTGCFAQPLTLKYHLGSGTSPVVRDTDGDGLSDSEEFHIYHTNSQSQDTDGDALNDLEEVRRGTDPLRTDTDGDGMPDGWEVQYGLDPLVNDAFGDLDEDGLPNVCEYNLNTKVGIPDTDDDDLLDGNEAAWIDMQATIPWFNTSGGTVLLTSSNVDRALFPVTLPTAIMLCGEMVTHALVDVNGIVRFGRAATTSGVDSVDGVGDLGYDRSFQTVVIAPFSADLYARSSLQSKITVMNLTSDGTQYAVFDFARMGTYSGDANEISFQVSVPLNCESNVVYVRYGDIVNASSYNISIGAQGSWNWPKLKYWYGQSPDVTNGMTIAYHLGCGSDPLSRHSDDDGLDDHREFELGTNPHYKDSDLDGLDDGWELAYDLDPLSEIGDDGPDGDSDDDGLSNAREYEYGTNPSSSFTDIDLIPDGVEVGYVTTNAPLPWLVFDSCEDLTTLISTNNRRCVNCATPFPLRIQGQNVTNLTISANGIVFFNRAGYMNPGDTTSAESFTYDVDENALVLAPYLQYAYIRSDIIDRQTSMRYGTATHDGNGYLLIEYLNSYYNTSTRPTNSISFQLAIPTNYPDRAYARYKDVFGTYMTGKNASIGMQSFDGRWMHSWCYHEDNRVVEGLTLEFIFGTNSNPCSEDSDIDGLYDDEELQRGTNLGDNDSDDDGLLDGWEVSYGLNPLSSEGDDGPDGDFDGDGLDNRLEVACATAPDDVDTDGDGLNDLIEAGGFLRTNPLPWFDLTSATDLTSSFHGEDEDLVNIQHSELTSIRNVAVSNIVLDANGILYLRRTGDASGVYSSGYGSSMAGYTRNDQSVSIAPFWTDFDLTVTNEPSTKISTAVVAVDGTSYRVFEYANMWTRRYGDDTWQRISFQVAIPYGDTDRVYIRYAGCSSSLMDGRYASIGLQGWNGHNKRSFCYNEEGRISSGTALTFVVGIGSNPNVEDSDNDGLSDSEEISIATNPLQPDTDGDGLNDGWESRYAVDGFDPTEPNANAPDEKTGPDDDLDGDGLSNRDECDWNTNPNELDSDGDGVDDGVEVGQFSDPDDETDDGRPASRVPVTFTFGDHSGSHSEKYRLELTPVASRNRTVSDEEMPKSISWVDAEYGECETKTAMLARGFDYELRMYHAGTNEEDSPDYDYRLILSYPPTVGVITNDPSGLINADDMTSDYFSGEGKVATIRVLDASIYGDHDRNGRIDENDRVALYKNRYLRHWVNDDEDNGDVSEGGGDIPGAGEGWLEWDGRDPNWKDPHVNGRCDLLDFAPVRLDINGMLSQLDGSSSDYAFRLSHADGAVKVVWTSEDSDHAGSFLTTDLANCGISLSQASHVATAVLVDSEGVTIPPSFINSIRSDSKKGVFLIEGCDETTSPLVFECRRSSDDESIFKVEMPLSVSSVEDMYWFYSLHGAEDVDYFPLPNHYTPRNLMDNPKDRDVFFTHGFNVSERDARAWGAEIFKRLWQSGSDARFRMVAWPGNYNWTGNWANGLHYQRDVYQALKSANAFKRLVEREQGDPSKRVVMAQSLGNMMASEALRQGLEASQYFMFDAAVASEAIDGTLQNANSTIRSKYVPSDWSDYDSRSWAANWHSWFRNDPADARGKMGWPDYFSTALSRAGAVYNYYSSGDTVFLETDTVPDVMTGVFHWPTLSWSWPLIDFNITAEEGCWQKQETHKGVEPIAGTLLGGWGFHCWDETVGGQSVQTYYTESQAHAMAENGSITNSPVFSCAGTPLNNRNASQNDIWLSLAKYVPAVSSPVGGTAALDSNNINLNNSTDVARPNGWGRNHNVYGTAWLHSDMKDMAYFYVFRLYEQVVTRGEMQ